MNPAKVGASAVLFNHRFDPAAASNGVKILLDWRLAPKWRIGAVIGEQHLLHPFGIPDSDSSKSNPYLLRRCLGRV